MKEDKYFEEKISRALEAIKHPENFTDEELRKLLNDTKCLQACRDLLDGKEALARQNATAPDIEKEWSKFSSQHTTQKDIRHKGELNSPDGAPKGKTRNIDTFGRKLSVPAVKRMRFIGLSIVLIAASIALLFWLYAPAHSYYTVFEARTVAQEISIHTHEGKNLLTVPRGMNNQITLTDGTRIWLNAESQLEYPENFEGQEKRVVRLKGEAYFEVKRNTAKPFIVRSEAMQVRVLGTVFNLKSDKTNRSAVATLIKGEIEVKGNHEEGMIVLAPGQEAELNAVTRRLVVKQVDTGIENWHNNQFVFEKADIFTIARTLENSYGVKIILAPDMDATKTYSGTLKKKDNVEETLNLIKSTNALPIEYKIVGNSVFLSSKK